MPLSNLPSNLSDRELILISLQQQAQLRTLVEEVHHDMREQLIRDGQRFEKLSELQQQLDGRVERFIQPITRAGVEAQRALKLSEQNRDRMHDIEVTLFGDKEEDRHGIVQIINGHSKTIDAIAYYAKIVGVIFLIIQVLIVPLFLRLVEKYLGL